MVLGWLKQGGGRGGGRLRGLGGSDWKGGSEDQKKDDRKEEGLEERNGGSTRRPGGLRIIAAIACNHGRHVANSVGFEKSPNTLSICDTAQSICDKSLAPEADTRC